MTLWSHCKSAASIMLIMLNLSFWLVPLVFLALLGFAVPALRARANRGMERIYRAAVAVDDAWFEGVIGIRWSRPPLALDRAETCIVLSNHTSWSDILILQSLIVRDGPLLKFLVKRELIWVPLLGAIFWAFGFPLLRRRPRAGESDSLRRDRDLAAVRQACEAIRERPASLMNFVEGTRFDAAKRKRRESPYEHLLRPRVGGLFAMVDALGDELDAVIDVTLVYDGSVSFWAFLSGDCAGIEVEAERIPGALVPTTRSDLEEWLEARWQRKDDRLGAR